MDGVIFKEMKAGLNNASFALLRTAKSPHLREFRDTSQSTSYFLYFHGNIAQDSCNSMIDHIKLRRKYDEN